MSEEKNRCEGECCMHDGCDEHCGHGFACNKGFFFVRWIFGLIILLMVFSIGVSIGRFVERVDSYDGYGSFSDRGYSGMMQYGNYNYGYGPGMMRSWVVQTPDAATQISVPAAKTK